MHTSSGATITVVITNHRYEQYLKECIESVLNQTSPPTEIIVIDDNPLDNTAREIADRCNIQYYRVEYNNPFETREAGYRFANSEYICYLDADDKLSKDYMYGVKKIITDHHSDVVYSDLHYFKSNSTYYRERGCPHDMSRKRISQMNLLHVGCAVRKSLIDTSRIFDKHVGEHEREDWSFWREILKTKCSYVKQQYPYLARLHDKNRSDRLQIREKYHIERGTDMSSITYVGKLNKYVDNLYCYEDWQNIANSEIREMNVMLFGNIDNNPVNRRYNLTQNKFTDTISMINRVAQTASTDYIFFYNENNRPELGKLNNMFMKLREDVAMVYDTNFDTFECALVVGDIFRDYYYRDVNHMPFNDNEKVIYI